MHIKWSVFLSILLVSYKKLSEEKEKHGSCLWAKALLILFRANIISQKAVK